ncbi:Hypothetical predicted protein [Podarcis lilfordi]|uniref:Uncharacterized protein n=1 Tax=Podarcis lilfordi TaxID=74358 RepID=A0AA35P4K4_9SAUR|nr:Hypothetical predicted protein [Podarcis lilfordi]
MRTDLLPFCRVLGGYCQAPRTVNCPFGENTLGFCGPHARCCRRGSRSRAFLVLKEIVTDETTLCTVLGGFCQGPITVNCTFGEITNVSCGPNARCCRNEPPLCTLLGGFCLAPRTENCTYEEITNVSCGPNARCCRRQFGCELAGGTCQFPATTKCTYGEIVWVSCGANAICCSRIPLECRRAGGFCQTPKTENCAFGDIQDGYCSDDDARCCSEEPPLCRALGGFCQFPITVECAFAEFSRISCGPNARCCWRIGRLRLPVLEFRCFEGSSRFRCATPPTPLTLGALTSLPGSRGVAERHTPEHQVLRTSDLRFFSGEP